MQNLVCIQHLCWRLRNRPLALGATFLSLSLIAVRDWTKMNTTEVNADHMRGEGNPIWGPPILPDVPIPAASIVKSLLDAMGTAIPSVPVRKQ